MPNIEDRDHETCIYLMAAVASSSTIGLNDAKDVLKFCQCIGRECNRWSNYHECCLDQVTIETAPR